MPISFIVGQKGTVHVVHLLHASKQIFSFPDISKYSIFVLVLTTTTNYKVQNTINRQKKEKKKS